MLCVILRAIVIYAVEKIIPVLLGGGLITFIYNSLQNKKKRERATIALYEKYHSIEFYSKIRAPLWKIQLKWFNDTPRYKYYRRVVVEGWVGYYAHSYLDISPERSPRSLYEKCYIEHHVTVSERTGLTEHQALTIGLEFWATLHVLKNRKLIDEKIIDLFKSQYKYNLPFIRNFREAVKKAAQEAQEAQEVQKQKTKVELPSWVKETEELESYFGFTEADYKCNE